ncbi:MAG: tRNA (adenosine(37)-N6)-threonylcarbamoyltransferase complex ATPase subunit type 1 TsaE [Candidatus Woykebacteria bacterium RBG_19FT_COMBO_43_10]|uniref:tRNA threonylcarbamoyladenosine biosynthesis protein TsaE n=1 Tax=Candidatus Woykebacteria bacterium RBG_19FT_COMBO_43_10 TaxID=1802598 RepID=A0A1G1WH63_9BACT|nr:MAG: tRNA (adenosine(37)-N6)-threonylcarbamoyltransferase complex ATPase subunit type 1 TsaE [Candidatus Woykebacteria bacterium RBG_19FT_COMBO_43_10]
MSQEFISNSAEETKKFAGEFAKKLKPGDILALYGDLGAGKTTFIQGLVAALGYKGKVFSPTFIFVRPYKISGQTSDFRWQKSGIKTFYHIDLYRIEEPADLKTIGIEEFLSENDSVSAIEWPERSEEELPERTVKIKFDYIDETKRRITVSE